VKKGPSKSAPSTPTDTSVEAPADWRGELLFRLRALIMEADPGMTEERKWRKPSNPAVKSPTGHWLKRRDLHPSPAMPKAGCPEALRRIGSLASANRKRIESRLLSEVLRKSDASGADHRPT